MSFYFLFLHEKKKKKLFPVVFLTFRWTFDPNVRMGVFAVFVGGTLLKLQGTCIIQPAVQRFLSLPGMKEVKQSLFTFIIGLVCLLSLCIYLGLLAFASYYDCDPISTGVSVIFRFVY